MLRYIILTLINSLNIIGETIPKDFLAPFMIWLICVIINYGIVFKGSNMGYNESFIYAYTRFEIGGFLITLLGPVLTILYVAGLISTFICKHLGL